MDLSQLPVDVVLLILYHYLPSKSAAIAAVVLYAVVAVAVTAISVKTKTYYMLTVAITGFLELGGWSTRLIMLQKPAMNTYIAHQGLLIISPVLLAIVEYITLGRLLEIGSNMNTANSNTAVVKVAPAAGTKSGPDADADGAAKPKRSHFATAVKWCFTCSDIICLMLQSTGGGMYSNPSTADLARSLLLVGLGAQLVFFSAFIVLTIYIHNSKHYGFRGNKAFRPVFICLYATTLLMHLRNAFRVAEFAEGFEGSLATHEYYLYIFDFMPIYACFLFFTFMHYGWWLGPNATAMVKIRESKQQVPVLQIECN